MFQLLHGQVLFTLYCIHIGNTDIEGGKKQRERTPFLIFLNIIFSLLLTLETDVSVSKISKFLTLGFSDKDGYS